MRQGGHSVAAPHQVVALIRQRLTAPVLEAASCIRVRTAAAIQRAGAAFAHVEIVMRLANVGSVAAYKWQLQASHLTGYPRAARTTPCGGASSSRSTTPTAASASTRRSCLAATCLRKLHSGFGSGRSVAGRVRSCASSRSSSALPCSTTASPRRSEKRRDHCGVRRQARLAGAGECDRGEAVAVGTGTAADSAHAPAPSRFIRELTGRLPSALDPSGRLVGWVGHARRKETPAELGTGVAAEDGR